MGACISYHKTSEKQSDNISRQIPSMDDVTVGE